MAIEKLEVNTVKDTGFIGSFITCDENIISAWKIGGVHYIFSGDKVCKITKWNAEHLNNWISTKHCPLPEKHLFSEIKPEHLDSVRTNRAKTRLNRGIPDFIKVFNNVKS